MLDDEHGEVRRHDLPDISPTSPLHLPYISLISPLYLQTLYLGEVHRQSGVKRADVYNHLAVGRLLES